MRARAAVRIALAAACVGAALSACASGTSQLPTRQQLTAQRYSNFRTAAAGNSGRQYMVYWLGPSITDAAGRKYSAGFNTLADAATGVYFPYSYESDAPNGGFLDVQVYAAADWATQRAQQLRQIPSVKVQQATVASRPAEVWVVSAPQRPINHIAVIVDFGATVVECSTTAMPRNLPGNTKNLSPTEYFGIAKTPTSTPLPDLNPLVDEQTLLAVLQHLRPYPQ